MGSSGKGTSTKTTYYGTIAGEVGVGPAYSLEWIVVSGIKAFTTPLVRPSGADYSDIELQGFGTARWYWGTETQVEDPLLNSYAPEPAHRGKVYLVLMDCAFGANGETMAPTIEVGWRRHPNQTIVTGTPAQTDDAFTANGVAVVSELLTSWDWNGVKAEKLNAATFQATAEALQAITPSGSSRSVAAIAPIWNEQGELRAALADISSVTRAWLRFGADGRIEAGYWSRGGLLINVPALTFTDLTEEPEKEVEENDTLLNAYTVEFRNSTKHHKSDAVTVKNGGAIKNDPNQKVKPGRAKRDMLITAEMASIAGGDLLRDSALPKTRLKLSVRRFRAKKPDGAWLRPGDYFTYPMQLSESEPADVRLFRCVRREFDLTGPIQITGELETNGAVQALVTAPGSLTDFNVTAPVYYRRVLAVNPETTDAPPPVYAFAARPDAMSIGFQLEYSATGSGDFQPIGYQEGFALPLGLAASFSDVAGTIRVKLLANTGDGVSARRDAHILQNWQGGALEGRDDQMLIFVMAKTAGVVTACECLSVNAPATVVATDTYDIPVLRGRRGTAAQAFTAGSFPNEWTEYECWMVSRLTIDPLSHADFLGAFGGSAVYFRYSAFGGPGGIYDPAAANAERTRRASNSIPLGEFVDQTTTDPQPTDNYTFPANKLPPIYSGSLGYVVTVYKRSATEPDLPEGGDYNNPLPAGWSLGTPVGSDTLWSSARRFTPNAVDQDPAWNALIRMEGVDGAPGADAKLVVLTSDAQSFLLPKDGGATSPVSIDLTAYGQNLDGVPTFTVAQGTATLTGAGANRELTPANMTTDFVVIKVEWDGQEDYISIVKVREGVDAVNGFLTNESHTVPASADGTVSSFSGAATEFEVFIGADNDTANWTFSKTDYGITTSLVGNLLTCTAMAGDSGYTEITAARTGFDSITKTFSIAKSKGGVDGADGGELVYNPDFTKGDVDWESASSVWDIASNLGEGGTRWGAHPNVGSPTQLVNHLNFRVKSGERYSIRAHGVGVNGYARITIFNAAGTEIDYITTDNFAATWGYKSQYGTIPKDGAYARGEFLSDDGATYVDWMRIQFIPSGVAYTPPDEMVPPVQWEAADVGGGLREVTLTNDDPSATLKYRVNGGSLITYSAPFTVSAFDVVTSFAERSGFVNSDPGRFAPQ